MNGITDLSQYLTGAGSHLKRLVTRHRTLPVAGLGAAGLLFIAFAVKLWMTQP